MKTSKIACAETLPPKETKNERSRVVGIDILKVFAVFFVLNSHMDVCYGKYSVLATGGAIGDALFFFCSGFTLFLGSEADFFNWYKRRISRIYPSVFVAGLVACAVWGSGKNILEVASCDGYWFLPCIFLYYLLIFPVKKYLQKYLREFFLLCVAVVVALYLGIFRELQTGIIYAGGGGGNFA